MKIAVVGEILFERSGARAPVKLAESLRQLGHQVDYLAFAERKEEGVAERFRRLGIGLYLYPGKAGWFSRWQAAFRLWRQLRQGGYEVVSNHSSFPFLVASCLSGKPLLKTYYGTQFYSYNQKYLAETGCQPSPVIKLKIQLFDALIYWREKLVFFLAPRQVAICRFLSGEAEQLYEAKIPYIYLGAESEDYHLENSHDPEDGLRVLSVSRIVPYKGFHYLIQAVQELRPQFPKLTLQIVGSSPDQSYLKYLHSLAGEETEIILSPSDQELANLYRQCSIYAVYDEWSPWSLTLLEASFFGKPLLAFGRGGFGEIIINGENGFTCQDLPDFSRKLAQLCADRQLRQRLGEGAQRLVQRFTWEKCAQEYLKLFESLPRFGPWLRDQRC